MLRKIAVLGALATALGLPVAVPAAQPMMPMHDTWDTNAPNGEPLNLGAGARGTGHMHATEVSQKNVKIDRAIVIEPGTQYVNVANGQTVLFKVGDKSFVRKFEAMVSHGNFPLSDIAPAGVNVQGVQVYCDPDLYEQAG